jgi:polyhydroxyalkanoate synthesis regulator phasin
MDAKEEQEVDREQKYKQRIFDAIEKLDVPTKSAVAMYRGKKQLNMKLIDQMLEDGELICEITQAKAANNRPVTVLKRNFI